MPDSVPAGPVASDSPPRMPQGVREARDYFRGRADSALSYLETLLNDEREEQEADQGVRLASSQASLKAAQGRRHFARARSARHKFTKGLPELKSGLPRPREVRAARKRKIGELLDVVKTVGSTMLDEPPGPAFKPFRTEGRSARPSAARQLGRADGAQALGNVQRGHDALIGGTKSRTAAGPRRRRRARRGTQRRRRRISTRRRPRRRGAQRRRHR